jgi:hypothetical protein
VFGVSVSVMWKERDGMRRRGETHGCPTPKPGIKSAQPSSPNLDPSTTLWFTNSAIQWMMAARCSL